MSVAVGQEDLRLQPNSPCRDLIPLSGVTQDVFGNPRPQGAGYDAGAYEFPVANMGVEFNATPVAKNGQVHVGDVLIYGGETRTFSITNSNPTDLQLTGTPPVQVAPGANLDSTAVQTQPALTTIPQNGSTTFVLHIDPTAGGAFDVQVSIPSSDTGANPFVFTVIGNGITNAAPQASATTGSSFIGVPGGPFVQAILPGGTLANSTIELTDFESDTITVSSITPFTFTPAGLTPPQPPPPGHPITLTWSGTADPLTPPDDYIWSVQFSDAVNGSTVTCIVHIVIGDLPPVHMIAAASSGDGSAANPYTASFTEGDGPATGIDLCTFTDPNTSQTVSIAGLIPAGTNPQGGAGFAFTIAGNALHVAPAGTLTDADAGTHGFNLDVTDGFNFLQIVVRLTVAALPPPLSITTPSPLSQGEVGKLYSRAIQTSGAVGPVTFTLQSGALPPGLSLSTGGIISGTPTQDGLFTFTIQAADMAAMDTRQFDVVIVPAPPASNPPRSSDGGTGCAAEAWASPWVMFALLVFAGAGLLRRRMLR